MATPGCSVLHSQKQVPCSSESSAHIRNIFCTMGIVEILFTFLLAVECRHISLSSASGMSCKDSVSKKRKTSKITSLSVKKKPLWSFVVIERFFCACALWYFHCNGVRKWRNFSCEKRGTDLLGNTMKLACDDMGLCKSNKIRIWKNQMTIWARCDAYYIFHLIRREYRRRSQPVRNLCLKR